MCLGFKTACLPQLKPTRINAKRKGRSVLIRASYLLIARPIIKVNLGKVGFDDSY